MQVDQFIIEQKKGKDSTVNVTEDIQSGYPNDTKILIFDTDQSLLSNSDRAWNVEKAIKEYADERGYRLRKITERMQARAVYDEDHYSFGLELKLRKQLKQHPDYLKAAKHASKQAKNLNDIYGKHINELKRLIFLLDQRLDTKLKVVASQLVEYQQEIIADMDTASIKDHHLSANRHPLIKIGTDYHYDRTDNIPNNLDEILELLD